MVVVLSLSMLLSLFILFSILPQVVQISFLFLFFMIIKEIVWFCFDSLLASSLSWSLLLLLLLFLRLVALFYLLVLFLGKHLFSCVWEVLFSFCCYHDSSSLFIKRCRYYYMCCSCGWFGCCCRRVFLFFVWGGGGGRSQHTQDNRRRVVRDRVFCFLFFYQFLLSLMLCLLVLLMWMVVFDSCCCYFLSLVRLEGEQKGRSWGGGEPAHKITEEYCWDWLLFFWLFCCGCCFVFSWFNMRRRENKGVVGGHKITVYEWRDWYLFSSRVLERLLFLY